MLTARRENERTLARLVGISEEEAAQRLAFKVKVRALDDASQAFAGHLRELLAFTLDVVGDAEPADLELAVNGHASDAAAHALVARIDEAGLCITYGRTDLAPVTMPPHDLCAKLAACYAAGVVIAHATGGHRRERLTFPFRVAFDTFGLTPRLLATQIELADTVLVGAGGVGSGFVWALESLDVRGVMDVADPKVVAAGNLNRCFYYAASDVGAGKATVLSAKARLDKLVLAPFVGTFNDLRGQRGRIKRAIVTVDSRHTRRDIQKEFPFEVLDASTTDVSEVIVHNHTTPNLGACLCCIYPHIPRENEQLQAIAEGLGVAVDAIRDKQLIDADLARELATLHGLDAPALEGVALSSLYKQLCAAEVLKTSAGEQAVAPFAFISNLAGVLLAVALLRFEDAAASKVASYMSLDPWSPPHGRARRSRAKTPNCEFCDDPIMTRLMSTIWHDRLCITPSLTDERAA